MQNLQNLTHSLLDDRHVFGLLGGVEHQFEGGGGLGIVNRVGYSVSCDGQDDVEDGDEEQNIDVLKDR
jgi:hypothetical protein